MTITLTREEAQQVLDALELLQTDIEWQFKSPTRAMLRKIEKTFRAKLSEPEPYKQPEDNRLLMQAYRAIHKKQPEPKPVAWRKLWEGETEYTYYWMNRYQGSEPLYTAPPQRKWVGLTDEELLDLADMAYANDLELLQTLQAKLKEKNYG